MDLKLFVETHNQQQQTIEELQSKQRELFQSNRDNLHKTLFGMSDAEIKKFYNSMVCSYIKYEIWDYLAEKNRLSALVEDEEAAV